MHTIFLFNFKESYFFYANDGNHGAELHYSSETGNSTHLNRDIFFGPESSMPENFSMVGASLYFSASTSEFGNELWMTDGSPNGTVLVNDVWPGTQSSYPSLMVSLFFQQKNRKPASFYNSTVFSKNE